MKTVAVIGLSLGLAGCALLPEMRIFQKKVPAIMSGKPPGQEEGERRAAAYIVVRSNTPPDPAAAVADIHQVATGLSASLGEPKKPVTVEDKDAVIAGLRGALQAKEAQLDAWKAFGRKYAGKELEQTGIDVAGPTGLLLLGGIIAACVFVPGFGYLALRVLPLLWGAVRRMAVGIESFAKDAPEAAAKLKKDYLARKMDESHKSLVRHRKATIRPEELETAPGAPIA